MVKKLEAKKNNNQLPDKKAEQPKAPKEKKTKNKRLNKLQNIEKITEDAKKDRGVVYVGHLPYGFEEEELKGYLSQFGTITNLRVSRSKKTARSRGFAFVEFASKEIARIAAKSMNGYLMYGRQIVSQLMEDEKVHPEMFKNANRKFKYIPQKQMFIANKNKAKTAEEKYLKVKFLLEREDARRKRLQELGYNFEFPGYVTLHVLTKQKQLIEGARKVFGKQQ